MGSSTSTPLATDQTPSDQQKQTPSEEPEEKDPSPSDGSAAAETDGGGEEEEAECGFCLFMKGGGCKDAFVAWEACVEEAEKNKEDVVEKCYQITGRLKECMEAHSGYYEPVLRAEKAMEEEAARELADQEAVPPPSSVDLVGGDGGVPPSSDVGKQ